MRVIARRTLREYWVKYSDAEQSLIEWFGMAEAATWTCPNDITEAFTGISILKNSRVCFNIKGNTYRLIVVVNYTTGFVLIKWFGTHAEYDRIDAETVNAPHV